MPEVIVNVRVEGAQQAENELRGLGDATGEVGGQAKTTTKSTKNLGSSVLGLAGGVGTATSGVFGLVDSFRDLEKKENSAAKAQKRASEATEKRVQAQQDLNDVLSDSTSTQADIAKATDKVNDAIRDEGIAYETARLKVEDSTIAHERHGFQVSQDVSQMASGALTAGSFASNIASAAKEAGPMARNLGKVAGAAGLVGGAVLGAVVASEELNEVRMADPKFAKKLEKDTKALEDFSVAGAAMPQLADAFKDLHVSAQATIDWVVDSVWPPIADFLSSIPEHLQKFVTDAIATINWVAEQIWGVVEPFIPDELQEFAADAIATITWIAEQVWQFVTVTVPETLQKFAGDAIATITWIAEQVWQFFTVTVPEALTNFATDAIATITWIAEQIWQFFTVTVPEGLKSLAASATAAITWIAQQVWQFFTVTIPEGLKSLAHNAVAAITWIAQQVWQFFTVTIPDGLKALKAQAIATITWVAQQIWQFFTVTVPEDLKAIAVKAVATFNWVADHIWSAIVKAVVPEDLRKTSADGTAKVTWKIENVFPPGSVIDQNIENWLKGVGAGGEAKKTVKIDADTSQAKQKIDALNSSITQGTTQAKTITVNAETATAEGNVSTLQQAINQLQGKTVTISVSVTGSGGAGAMGVGKGSIGLRHGGTTVIDKPTNVRVGEGFHPELVSVTPLDRAAAHGGSKGTALHPHAQGGGNFISGLQSQVDSIAKGVVEGIASSVEREEKRVQDQKHQLALANWNTQLAKLSSEIFKLSKAVVQAQQNLNNVKAANTPGAIPGYQAALDKANAKYTTATATYNALLNNKPQKPTVTVQVTGLAKGFNGIVQKPTMFLAGEAGPESLNVAPLKSGTHSSSSGSGGGGGDLARLADSLDKLVSNLGGRGGGSSMNANLFVDGQKMASVTSKYIGAKAYGDR